MNQKGSAFIMAIFGVALLAIIGIGLVLNIQTDRALSRNWAATSKALFAADTGIQKLRDLLDYDYAHDRIGFNTTRGWANRWLVVPDGTAGALQTNTGGTGPSGEAVGLASVSFFDLGSDPNEYPYYINTGIPGTTGVISGNNWRVLFRNFKERPGLSNPFSDRRLFLLVSGVSETYGTGPEIINAGRFIEQGLAAEPISVWDNIAFLGGAPSDPDVLGNIKWHGSVHIIDGTVGDATIDLGGNVGMENFYPGPTLATGCCGNTDPDTMLTDKLAPLPINANGLSTLNSKIRIRKGDLVIGGSGTIGCPTNTGNSVKETFDALYINGSFPTSQVYFDKVDNYDVPDDLLDKLVFPDPISNSQSYFHAETNRTFPNYQAFLVGDADGNYATADFGAAALDLTAINYSLSNNANNRWEFDHEPNDNVRESRELLAQIITPPAGTEDRGKSANNDAYINGRNKSWLLRNLDGGHNPTGNPSLPLAMPFAAGYQDLFWI